MRLLCVRRAIRESPLRVVLLVIALAALASCGPALAQGNEKDLPATESAVAQPAAATPEAPAPLPSANERGNEKGLRVVSESWREAKLYDKILEEKEALARAAEVAAEAAEGRRPHRSIYPRVHVAWDDWWPFYGSYWGGLTWWGPRPGLGLGAGVYHHVPRP